jgi:hypothetical protein
VSFDPRFLRKDKEELIKDLKSISSQLAVKERELNELQTKSVEKDQLITGFQQDLQVKTQEIKTLNESLADITSKYTIIFDKYQNIKDLPKRPIVTPLQLAGSFHNAINKMRTEFKTPEDSPVDYRISKFDITLKSGIGVSEKEDVIFWLPKTDEISPDYMSTIQFSIKAVPKVRKRIKK